MGSSLAVIEQNLKPLLPKLQQVLAGRMPVERLARTVLVSCEKTPKLLDCSQQSIFNAAMSAATSAHGRTPCRRCGGAGAFPPNSCSSTIACWGGSIWVPLNAGEAMMFPAEWEITRGRAGENGHVKWGKTIFPSPFPASAILSRPGRPSTPPILHHLLPPTSSFLTRYHNP